MRQYAAGNCNANSGLARRFVTMLKRGRVVKLKNVIQPTAAD
ncbi:MAG: hypothetical protein ACE5PO_08820 [Candidatus Bathyarchaeia archaeon]